MGLVIRLMVGFHGSCHWVDGGLSWVLSLGCWWVVMGLVIGLVDLVIGLLVGCHGSCH